MSPQQPRYSAEETARRGDEIYEREVRAWVEAGNHGKVVAIDNLLVVANEYRDCPWAFAPTLPQEVCGS